MASQHADHEEEDGAGWGGLVPTKAERLEEEREKRLTAELTALRAERDDYKARWQGLSNEAMELDELDSLSARVAELRDALKTIAAENEHEGWEGTTPLARAALRRSAPQSGWIAVTERLPDDDREVLVCGDAFGDPAMGRWQEVASWNGTAWISDSLGVPIGFITHWRELPSPPAEEKKA